MTISIVSWFVLGFLAGVATLATVSIIAINSERNAEVEEEFVKKLVEQKGWNDACWELKFKFKGKYMGTWRKLYKKHIMEEQKK